MSLLRDELKRAEDFAIATAATGTGGRVIRPKFNNMRGFG